MQVHMYNESLVGRSARHVQKSTTLICILCSMSFGISFIDMVRTVQGLNGVYVSGIRKVVIKHGCNTDAFQMEPL